MKQCLSVSAVILAVGFGAHQAAAADAAPLSRLSRASPLQNTAAVPPNFHAGSVVVNSRKQAKFRLKRASDQPRPVATVWTQSLPHLAARSLPAAKTSASGFNADSHYPLPKAATGVFVRDDAFLPASRTLSLYITPNARQYTNLILDAAAQWNSACGVHFKYVDGKAPTAAVPGSTVVVVDYGPGAMDGASAMTFPKASPDKQTMSYARVVITTIQGDADLYFLALHELGHALGLPHASDPGAVMHWTAERTYYISTGALARLTSTDIDGCHQMLAVAERIRASRVHLAELSF